MTRSKIQKIKFCVFLLIFLLFQLAACNANLRENRKDIKSVPSIDKNDNKETEDVILNVSKDILNDAQNAKINDSGTNVKIPIANITSKVVSGASATISPATSTIQAPSEMHMPSVNSGALIRGISVVIGLSVIVMAYMVFRSLRLSKTRAQMVRKYGVLAHRQDVEMRPLPLDEDDDDDTTVFDASNISSNRLQSQDS